ncbi:Leucine zipper transcription factor-like protein 1 [Rhizoclosmatium sp. JEL0117]|nr:Leucine zipper transcription factor-like protein 1 [Rhizoclosmatium sp. JEL0117]
MESELHRYLIFMRKQRADSLKELRLTLKEVAERRVTETTYNSDDVREILNDATVNCEATFQSEGMLQSHMNMLLIQQYLTQAGAKGLVLVGDMKELENRDRLAEAAEFEENLFSGRAGTLEARPQPEANPINNGETILLKGKIAELEKALNDLKMNAIVQRPVKNETPDLLRKISLMSERIKGLETDLEGRIDKSMPVQNLKKMLQQKNELLKEYRTKLSKYDPSFLEGCS